MTSVVVPWRESPTRVPTWEWLRIRWQARRYDVVEGYCPPDGPWRKGAAVADGMTRTTGTAVIADADVWCDGVDEAVRAVEAGAAWAVPHHRVLRLNQAATVHALTTGQFVLSPAHLEERPYPGRIGGGLVVLRRDLYATAPIDPRFAGWGQEDEAWGIALRALYGRPWRGTADLIHLWHQPQPRATRTVGSDDGTALLRRYMNVANDPAGMRTLLDEARRWPHG